MKLAPTAATLCTLDEAGKVVKEEEVAAALIQASWRLWFA